MIKRHSILKVLIIVFVLISSTTTPAHAWKVKTHVYSANLILDEIRNNNGYVEIKPYGKFQIDPNLEPLLRLYPEFYRAGALGPDLQPDIIIGQTIFHPGLGNSTSGEYIEDLWWAANNIKDRELTENEKMLYNSMQSTVYIPRVNPNDANDPASKYLKANNRDQARAYVLGLMAHAAGDYFGHSYINNWAGGTWPNMADGLSSAEKDIIRRHSVIEKYIDSKIPTKYKSNEYNRIASPQRFLFDNTLVRGTFNLNNVLDDDRRPEFALYSIETPHLDLFFSIRDACKRRIDKINRNRSGDLLDKAVWLLSVQYAQKAYCEAWIEDIDRGLGDWIAANERAAQKMLLDGNGMEQYKEELKKWADKHLLSMLGAPDVAVTVINALGSVTDFVMEIVPDAIEKAYKDAKQDILNYIVKKSFGVDLKEWMSLLDPPLSVLQTGNLFPTGTFEKLNVEMGNFNTNTNTTEQELEPFKNTLTFMKLMLIGEKGIQELRKAAGCTGPANNEWEWYTLTQFIENMDYGYKWGEEEPLEGFYLSESVEDKEKIVNVIFNLESNNRKERFSDMTKGPIEVVEDKGICPDISVKYCDAPVWGTIGFYSVDSIGIEDAIEAFEVDNNHTSGTFKTIAEEMSGKFHFRMYSREKLLIATSDTIEVINKKRVINFSHIPDEPLKPGEYFSFLLYNGNYKNGYYALYSENENDPSKFTGIKEKINYLEYEYERYAPEIPGRYKLRAYDNNNILLAESSIIIVAKEGETPLKPPVEIIEDRHVEVFNKGVIMSWPSKNGLGYRLFRSKTENDLGISVTDFYITSNSYADVNVEPNTVYYYTVKPVLAEANPLKGIEEDLGDVIERYNIKTGNDITKSENQKNFIVLQIDNPNMSVNGIAQEIDQGRGTTPIVVSSRSMVPIRAIVEAMGGTISWDNLSQQITLIANGNTVNMWIGKKEITVNGVPREMDVAPAVQNGRTYVPLRFATENFNAEIEWINSTREAVIIY